MENNSVTSDKDSNSPGVERVNVDQDMTQLALIGLRLKKLRSLRLVKKFDDCLILVRQFNMMKDLIKDDSVDSVECLYEIFLCLWYSEHADMAAKETFACIFMECLIKFYATLPPRHTVATLPLYSDGISFAFNSEIAFDSEFFDNKIEAMRAFGMSGSGENAIYYKQLVRRYIGKRRRVAIIAHERSVFDPYVRLRGIPGSEEAIIEFSDSLSLNGFQVDIYCDPPLNSPYTIDIANPRYVKFNRYTSENERARYEIVIMWRRVDFANFKTKENLVIYWPHDFYFFTEPFKIVTTDLPTQSLSKTSDLPTQPLSKTSDFPTQPLSKTSHLSTVNILDGILWLSKWQQKNFVDHMPNLNDVSQVIMGNGYVKHHFYPSSTDAVRIIHPNLAITEEDREKCEKKRLSNRLSIIYASSYVRGLSILLDIWPSIIAKYPEATLDIYYGRNTWGCGSVTQDMITKISQRGIKEHGCVSHIEIAKAFLSSSIWAYPCTYDETFCITALKAQASGCIPIATNKGALAEVLLSGYNSSSIETYSKFIMIEIERISTSSAIDLAKERQKIRKEVLERKMSWDDAFEKFLFFIT